MDRKANYQMNSSEGLLPIEIIHKRRISPGPNRDLTQSWVNQIAKTWTYKMLGVLKVRPIESITDRQRYLDLQKQGYTHEAIVGGHRLAAAMKRSDIDLLNTEVISVGDREALEIWKREAKERKNATPTDIFTIAILSGETWAVEIQEQASRIGRTISKTKTSTTKKIGCVNTLKRLYLKEGGRAALMAVMPLVGTIAGNRPIPDRFVAAIIELERRILLLDRSKPNEQRQNTSLMQTKWHDRLTNIGYGELMSVINLTAKKSGAHEKIWAKAIFDRINTDMRYRLDAQGLRDDD